MPLMESIIRIFAPHSCLSCDAEGSLLCNSCWYVLKFAKPECYKCHKPNKNSKTCRECHKISHISNVWVRSNYLLTAKELLHLLKFERNYEAHKIIAKALGESIGYLNPKTIIVPVTTSNSRKRERGYDQSELIARELSRIFNLPYRRYLLRLGNTRQLGANRAKRLTQLNNSYYVPYNIKGKHILLVDDVLTTGATLDSAAKVLKKAGARKIKAAIFARAL